MTFLATHPLSFMRGVFCAHTAGAIDDLGLRQPTSGGSALYREEGLNECLPRANPILPQRAIPDAFPDSMPLLLSATGPFPSSPFQTRLRSSRNRAYRARSRNYPVGPPVSFCAFFSYLFPHSRQFAATFAEVATALPSRLLGTSPRPDRLLSQGRFPSHGIWPGQQRCGIPPARPWPWLWPGPLGREEPSCGPGIS